MNGEEAFLGHLMMSEGASLCHRSEHESDHDTRYEQFGQNGKNLSAVGIKFCERVQHRGNWIS